MSLGAPSILVGLVVVRGGGAPMVQRRLPRRSPASIGRRDRYAFELQPEWVPRDLGTFMPVDEGWLLTNTSRAWMRVESDFIRTGAAVLRSDAITMLQRGDYRISWEGIDPLSLSVTVRTRRLDDQRIPYAVDSAVDTRVEGSGSYLGVTDAPITAALRYRLAVLFRHLIEGELEPRNLLVKRAETLGITPEELEAVAHRFRRRLNVVQGLDLQSIEELGEYLVLKSDELTREDLEP
jgi:hypothetical protein